MKADLDGGPMGWVEIAELATALGTIALAVATGCMSWLSYKSIRQAEEKEKHHSTPIVVFDFNDAEGEEGQGAPGFRMHPDSGTGHKKALLSGILRNISAVAAIDCRLRIVYTGGEQPLCEFNDLPVCSGVAAGERIDISKEITMADIYVENLPELNGQKIFSIGIRGLFEILGAKPDEEYPYYLEFVYSNVYGETFTTRYAMKLFMWPVPQGRFYRKMIFKTTGRALPSADKETS